MKSIKQVLRQPVKMAAGILLVALGVAALCVCVGQSFAAKATQSKLDETYLSIALPMGNYDENTDAWALAYAEEHPEVVASVGNLGLISASIEDIELVNFNEDFRGDATNSNNNFPYNRAILEVEITNVPVVHNKATDAVVVDGNTISFTYYDEIYIENGIVPDRGSVELKGKVLSCYGLQKGYADPVGYDVNIQYLFRTEDADTIDFQVGQRYLVYGWEYTDLDYELRRSIAIGRKASDVVYGGKRYFSYHFDEEKLIPIPNSRGGDDFIYKIRINDAYVGLRTRDMEQFRTISVNAYDKTDFRSYTWMDVGDKYDYLLDDYGYTGVLNWRPNGQGGMTRTSYAYEADFIDTVSWISDDWKTLQMPYEEYHEKYPFLTIVPLHGTVEEFLSSEEGAFWQAAIEEMEVNNHAFAVIGVENMLDISDVAMNKMQVVEGHAFTKEELEKGEKVCLISSLLAKANGLEVGDTIHPSFYLSDMNVPDQLTLAMRDDAVDESGAYILLSGYDEKDAFFYSNPNPYYFNAATMELQETETYTVVGIIEGYEWVDGSDNLYCFTPNTIFVPAASIKYPMERGQWGFYRNFIITNGMMDEFGEAIVQARYVDHFYLNDDGYSAVESSMDTYRENARRAMMIGVAVYGVLALAYILLFPLRQSPVLGIMYSMGVPRPKRIAHVCISSLAVLVPGTILGAGAGVLLWQRVTDALLESVGSILSVDMEPQVLILLAVAALFTLLLGVLLVAIPLTKVRGLKKELK